MVAEPRMKLGGNIFIAIRTSLQDRIREDEFV